MCIKLIILYNIVNIPIYNDKIIIYECTKLIASAI